MKGAARRNRTVAGVLSLRGPLCAGEAFILRRLLRRAAARARRGAPVRSASSPYGLLASTPHIAAAPLNYVVGLRPSRGLLSPPRSL